MDSPLFHMENGVLYNGEGALPWPCLLLDAGQGVLMSIRNRGEAEERFASFLAALDPQAPVEELDDSRFTRHPISGQAEFVMLDLRSAGLGAEETWALVEHLLSRTNPEFVRNLCDALVNGASIPMFVWDQLGEKESLHPA